MEFLDSRNSSFCSPGPLTNIFSPRDSTISILWTFATLPCSWSSTKM